MDYEDADGLQEMDTPLPPPLLPMEQQQQASVDLDHQFGNMLCRLMDGQISAADAVKELQQHSAAVVQCYRAEAADELNPAAHRITMDTLASELEAQAASWQLLQALYCSDGMPAGVYEGAAGVGNRLTLRQLLADTVNGDDNLRRFAQVVMWLEALAAQKLPDPLRDPSCRFGPQEGVWKETLRGLGSSTRQGGSADSELDPDAPSRDQLRLALADREAGLKLAAWAWRLVRAGRCQDACELCIKAGQPWRAVSLSGAGPWGPLPVGPAAGAAAASTDKQDPADECAYEVEGGAASARLAWKWACVAAAATAGPSEDGEGGNKYEAALYGALCGDVRHMLPACDSWEDEAWAYCRAWLELQTEAQLLQDCRGQDSSEPQAQAAAQEFYLGAPGDNNEAAEVPQELLAGLVDLAARSDYTQQPNKQLLREGLAVMNGDWPLPRLGVAGDHLCVPTNFKELYDLLSTSSNTHISNAAQQPQHLLQLSLMSEDWNSLVLGISGTSKAAHQALNQHRLQQQTQGTTATPAAGSGGADDVVRAGEGYEAGGRPGMSREAAVDVLRFNAHVALALRALGLMPDPFTVQDDTDTLHMLQQVLSRVVCQYAAHLATLPDSLYLVPAYLCHLRLPERRSLSTLLLQTALDSGASEQDAESLHTTLAAGTEFWYDRQRQQQAEGGSADNQLFGDLRPEEARMLLQHNVYQAFSSAATSPKQRCDHLRWMYYGFVTAARAAAAAALEQQDDQQQQQVAWQGGWADALSNTLGLAAQLVLNPGASGPGLTYLLQDVVPQDFTGVAAAAAAAAAGVEGDAAGCSSSVSHAAGVDVVQPEGQLQVQRQLLALTFWQHYADIEGRYQAWKQARNALASAAAAGGGEAAGDGMSDQAAFTSEAAVPLVQDMLRLAGADALRLPAPEHLRRLIHSMTAAAGSGAGVSLPAAVPQDGLLSLPQYDAPVNRLLLEAYAEGSVEQVLGLLPHSELQLAVTSARRQPDLVAAGAAVAADGGAALPARAVEYYEVPLLQERITTHLAAATSSLPDVHFMVGLPPEGEPLDGCVLVKLTCYSKQATGSSSSGGGGGGDDRRELDSRELQAWQDMVAVAVGLLEAGSKRCWGPAGAADGGDNGDSGVPRLAVVYLNSSLSTQLAISRRRTTSKLLRRSAKVLQVLCGCGYRGPLVEGLLDGVLLLAADGDQSQGLLGQLSQADSAQLLQRVAEVMALMGSSTV